MKQKFVPGKPPAEQVLKDHSTTDPPALFGGGEDPHCSGRVARRGEYLRALSPRGHCRLDVLRLVEGVPRGRQAPFGGGHGASCDVGRGERSPP